MRVNLASVSRIINNNLERSKSYNACKYFVQHDEDFRRAYIAQQ